MSDTASAGAGSAPVEIDPALVAPGLGLDVATFRRLMAEQRIPVLCERGTGADAGYVRGTFYYAGRRVRIVVDRHGRPVAAGGVAAAATPGDR